MLLLRQLPRVEVSPRSIRGRRSWPGRKEWGRRTPRRSSRFVTSPTCCPCVTTYQMTATTSTTSATPDTTITTTMVPPSLTHPKVNTYASAPGWLNVISSVRCSTRSCALASWYRRPSLEHAAPFLVDVDAVRRSRLLAVETNFEGDRVVHPGRHHEVGVSHVVPVRDAPRAVLEDDPLEADRPVPGQGPPVVRQGRVRFVHARLVEGGGGR